MAFKTLSQQYAGNIEILKINIIDQREKSWDDGPIENSHS